MRVDKFKIYLPVLEAVCRKGLKNSHWIQISEKLGKSCNPAIYPSLQKLIDAGILNILSQLEEISITATKEYELNIQLMSAQDDWENVEFEILPYRNTNTYILSGIDDIQTMLDDHILKSQAIRSSPYVATLIEKSYEWENKLISVQETIDIWSQVQSSWMYLEPVFGSQDIIRQMPIEGRIFKSVDKTWQNIMNRTNENKKVMLATSYPDLLELLQKAMENLELVRKGLGTYLEHKRLFFPRLFFLSNEELLEILSEAKEPSKIQPYLNKCFEGVIKAFNKF